MKLTVTFIVVALGSMIASAAEPAVISSATSSIASSATSTGIATSKIAIPTPPAPVQAAPTPADKSKVTIPYPNRHIRPPHNHWFAPHKPYKPAPYPYGYPQKPYLGGAQHQSGTPSNQGALREKRFKPQHWELGACAGINCGGIAPHPALRIYSKRSIPEASVLTQAPPQKRPSLPAWMMTCGKIGGCGPNNHWDRMQRFRSGGMSKRAHMICLQLGGCGGGLKWWRPRSIIPTRPNHPWWRFPAPTQPTLFPFRRPAQKRAPIIAPICAGLNCGGVRPFPFRRPITWPYRTRVNARSAEAEAEAEPEALWCNQATGTGCGPDYRRKNGGPINW